MLKKQRCPHTGIVNYFVDSDPKLSVACVYERRGGLVWLCHLSETGGRATTVAEAECAVREALAAPAERACLASDGRRVDAARPAL